MVRINDLKQKLIITAALLTVVTVMYFAHIPCPILRLTGFECPGCGMTRALAAALRLDFSSAFSYHMMFWSVPVLYLCFLFDGRLFSKKWLNTLLYSLLTLGFLINYII